MAGGLLRELRMRLLLRLLVVPPRLRVVLRLLLVFFRVLLVGFLRERVPPRVAEVLACVRRLVADVFFLVIAQMFLNEHYNTLGKGVGRGEEIRILIMKECNEFLNANRGCSST